MRIVGGLLLASLLAPVPAAALHRDSAPAVRITRGAGAAIPRTRGWRTWLPLTSTEDLTGTGTTGRQAFVFDLWTYDCIVKPNGSVRAACKFPNAPYLVQVTSGPGAPDNPSVNGVGRLVAFDADGAYAGGGGPGASRRQIFLLDRRSGDLTRVTAAADGDSVRPSLDDAGRTLVFESTAALAGGTAGTAQIFVYDVRAKTLEQVTSGRGGSHEPMADKRGKRIAFASTADLLGDGHDTGISQIFWYERSYGALHQLTRGNAASRHPFIGVLKPSGKLHPMLGLTRIQGGPSIVFESAATDLPGTRGGPGTQIHFGTMVAGDLPPIVQLTPPPVLGCSPPVPGNSTDPVIEPAARRVLFTSDGDLLCNGTSGRRLFAFTVAGRPGLLQLTARGDVQPPVAALGGWFAALSTSEDLSGTGSCGPQVHAINYFEGMWRPASLPGTLPEERPPGPRAASCDDGNACTTDVCSATSTCTHTPIASCGP